MGHEDRVTTVFRLALCLVAALLLAACSSAGPLGDAPVMADQSLVLPDQYGSGPRAVGIIAFEEPGNLSDGAPDSIHRAARLAATTLKGNPVTVVVRTLAVDGGNAGGIVNELDAASAGIVVGAGDEAVAAAAANVLGRRAVPTLSLTSFSDIAIHLYGAGYVPNEEAVTLVNEAAKRGITSLAVVSAAGRASESFTRAVLSLAGAAGISARPVDGSTDSQFVAGLGAMVSAGVDVGAVVFATGPERAGAMLSLLRQDARFATLQAIGNSGWSLGSRPPSLKGAWYTALDSNGLAEFAAKFRAANGGSSPTLNAAMVYDLIILAAALPQAAGEMEPYHPEVLTGPQGFHGFTGHFRFGPTGMLGARAYVIRTVD